MDRELIARTMAPPGASQDLFLRALEPIFTERFAGTRLVVANAPGEDGVVAARRAKTDPPDGCHILVTSATTMSFYPAAGGAGFEVDDFELLLGIGQYSFVLITAGDQPWSDLHEVFDRVRAQGRALRHAGTGQPDFLLVAAMGRRAGLDVEFTQLNGPALIDAVVSKAADIGLGTGTHQPLLAEGRVRVVAQLHPRADRGPGAAPTPKNFGVDATLDNFILVSAPKGLNPADGDRLVRQFTEAVGTPDIATLLAKRLLMAPGLLQGAELRATIAAQSEVFGALRADKRGRSTRAS
jgi:tripartite-type tricarboxylate transporter receptor subunit TctC